MKRVRYTQKERKGFVYISILCFVQEVYRLKKLLRIVMITFLILAVDLYGKLLVSQYILTPSQSKQENKIVKKKKQIKEDSSDTVLNMIGEDSENLLAKWGEPSRIEPSAYGYEWWVYNQDLTQYVQFGVSERKVVTAYALVNKLRFHLII